ncbi:MAG: glycosyltransferase family 39 protein [Verrucomicrobia bacterium]|nr:glycosyltransferase family 39 protein [Verrucomicrobiota bacterium]
MNPQPLGIGRAALVALAAFALLFCTAGLADFGRRDARNAVAAREMLASGDWLVPTLGGQPRFEKPPLMYWAIAGASQLLTGGGVNEWTAALPSALAGALACAMVAALGAQFWGRSAGLLAAAMLVTSFGFFKWGRTAQMEVLLTATITLAVGCFILWDHQPRKLWLLFAAHAFAALACMAKGPVALVFTVTGEALYGATRWLAGQPCRHLVTRWHAFGLVIFFALALPWPALVMAQGDAKEVFMHEVFGRLAAGWQRHAAGPFFYCAALPALVAPWTLALPLVAWLFWRERGALRRQHAPAVFLAVWFVVVFAFFSSLQAKQDHYILPILPACVLLAAWAAAGVRWAGRVAWIVAAVTAIGLLVNHGVIVPRADAKTSPRAFVAEAHRIIGGQRSATALYFGYGDSITADMRADIFYYLGPQTRLLAVSDKQAPATAADFVKLAGDCRFVVLNRKSWPASWGAELPGWRVALARKLEGGEFVLLGRAAP